ncbi:MAG: DUF5610 domain-containing protein [Magnetococcales bacterium]|nr:DUF5610 domain-containing protein [Magnetococcales bacterium]
MMIQAVGAEQMYRLLTKGGESRSTLPSQKVVNTDNLRAGSAQQGSKQDSSSFSVEGMAAFANQKLQEKAVAELNRMIQETDEDAKPLEALDPDAHTPEKTAEAIVSLSTGFFDRYTQGHPEMAGQELLDGFMAVISGGIKQGLEAARELLEGLEVLHGLVEKGVNQSDQLIWEKLDQFYAEKKASMAPSPGAEADYAQAA